ncbi:hypothetical protein QQF64_001636 [Cirrhinus molitorella]|uniref:Uncharacterized protein n=1 Tax=Cirrhinus molitorella TaxID=172907 RepID=A0ABR3P1J5_9TELE
MVPPQSSAARRYITAICTKIPKEDFGEVEVIRPFRQFCFLQYLCWMTSWITHISRERELRKVIIKHHLFRYATVLITARESAIASQSSSRKVSGGRRFYRILKLLLKICNL